MIFGIKEYEFKACRDNVNQKSQCFIKASELSAEKKSVGKNPYEESKNFPKLVEVVFYDPAEYDTNYHKDLNPIECRTIGWLEKQDSAMVRISWLREGTDAPYVGLAVPMGCVKSIQEVTNK